VNDPALHLALRELQQVFRRPRLWIILGAVIAVLGISGPFGTLESLRFGPRLAYWAVTAVLTLASGWLVSQWLTLALERRGAAPWLQGLVASLAVALLVAAEMALLNAAAFGQWPLTSADLRDLGLSTMPIAVLITGAILWGHVPAPATAAPAVETPRPPRLLNRLPLEKRGALVSLSVQDHYVEIVTTRGRALVLLRLADAIAEAEGCPGLQVHRSHWVSLAQVQAARREGARGLLVLSDGRQIPVSRSFLPSAKAAGLF